MDINIIKSLVKLVEKSDIDELKLEEKDFKIRITKHGNVKTLAEPAPAVIQAPLPAPQISSFEHKVQEAPVHEASKAEGGEDLLEICSPMVGTFYRSPAPDADPYVKVGDGIEPGKVLCIIEAMKLMNELEAEVSGEIVKILVENAQPVEYNQPLFLIKKH
jgi:acetyl-CoA carboxylase biotin carboxyl carrier protein